MKEYVLVGKDSGAIALGIKLHAFDNPDEKPMKDGSGKVVWLPSNPDFWAVCTRAGGVFTLIPFDVVDKHTEIIAEL